MNRRKAVWRLESRAGSPGLRSGVWATEGSEHCRRLSLVMGLDRGPRGHVRWGKDVQLCVGSRSGTPGHESKGWARPADWAVSAAKAHMRTRCTRLGDFEDKFACIGDHTRSTSELRSQILWLRLNVFLCGLSSESCALLLLSCN